MKQLRNITDNEIAKICSLVNEEYQDHSFNLTDQRHLSIRVKYVETGSYKYLSVYENGLVQLFTFNPSMMQQIKQLSVHALLITDYLRQKGYEFNYEQ